MDSTKNDPKLTAEELAKFDDKVRMAHVRMVHGLNGFLAAMRYAISEELLQGGMGERDSRLVSGTILSLARIVHADLDVQIAEGLAEDMRNIIEPEAFEAWRARFAAQTNALVKEFEAQRASKEVVRGVNNPK